MRIKSLILPTLSAIAVGLLAFTLASHRTGASVPVSNAPVTATAVTVKIDNFAFKPPTLTVRTGTRVTFTNFDGTPHTATADQGGFDTGTLNKDKSMTITFNKPGTFAYHCQFHAFMTATIRVVS
ncbi:MAG TPA: cupredoxin domain-containing protein [Solirubrobacteraceae bacterium]|jgi:plastocyanin|nr:cupredoxin domain-containing protein [Solirubrobacteraceae bacterium]